MSELLQCPNGHEWQPKAGESAGPGGEVSFCPVCGSLALTHPGAPTLPQPAGAAGPALPHVSGYQILEELGRGGMGIVYQARHLGTGRLVALKVIRKERLSHPEMVSRFRREAQAAARLSHPNVVVVYEADQDGEVHFLSMEYVPGVTLQRLVEQSGPLPVARACDFIRQTALGLQHAHEQALVHRDIKPANLMVVAPPPRGEGNAPRGLGNDPVPQAPRPLRPPRGEGNASVPLSPPRGEGNASAPLSPSAPLPARPVVKILDMGVARLYQLRHHPEDSLTTLTRDGAVVGTPDYIAPEQLEDPHGADIRADLYSLGCTFYFLLSGRVPFPGGTLIQKLDRQRWETAPSVDQLRPEVPAAVAAVVRRLMAKHPDDRYRTPGELAAALDHLTRTGVLPRGHQPTAVRETACLRGPAAVVGVAFLADGRAVVAGGADRALAVWDLAAGRERLRFGESPYEIGCLAVVPSTGQVLAGQGVSVRVWDPDGGREVLRLAGHTDAVRGIAVGTGGDYALTGGDDRTVRLWDLHSGREVLRLTGHRAAVTGVALSADGRLAASGGRDQTLRLWDAGSGRELRSFAVPRGPVLGVAFTADGRGVVSGHFDTTVRLWEADTGRELRRFSGHRQMVAAVAVLPDGRVASAGHDGTVRLWDADSGAELGRCEGHAGPVRCVAASPGGTHLASGGSDQTIRLWELPA